MKTEDQIKALAELDGWTYSGFTWTSPSGSHHADRAQRLTNDSPLELVPLNQILPNYLTSYDAIIPLIQKQSMEVRVNLFTGSRVSIMTTPAQLSEAMLRATGKWKE